MEGFIKHSYFGLICPECQKEGSHFIKLLKIYNDKQIGGFKNE